ncbi:MAG: HAD family hydrolase [Desulfobacterota bacterium]|nr:HAD family hydrolase [Thermodesulfobacteriota bacterium]
MRQSPLQGLKAIVFDFDGTLAVLNIDFSLMRERVFALIRQYGLREERIRERYLLEIIDEVYPLLREENPTGAQTFYEEAHRILKEVELEAADQGRLLSGVEEVLRGLREAGLKIGIITRNCEEAVRRVFPAIDDFCDVFISRDSVRKVKPHPEHLNLVLKVLGVSGGEAAMVGDHLIDIQAGKKVGMVTIGVLTGRIKREEFEEAGADYILNDVTGLCSMVKLTTEGESIRGGEDHG